MIKLLLVLLISSLAFAERHPFINTDLKCLAKRSSGTMYSEMISRKTGKVIARFTGSGPTYYCAVSRRKSSKDKVCIPKGYRDYRVYNTQTGSLSAKYTSLNACISSYYPNHSQRLTAEGMQFFNEDQLAYIRSRLPRLADPKMDAVLQNKATVYYDDTNMVFGYQDSSGSPIGMRGQRMGYDTGINSNVPDIRLLTELFKDDKFLFPFATAGGTDGIDNKYIMNFWLPPKNDAGKYEPVIYYKVKSHWSWIFPVGTVVGEVIFQQDDQGEFFPFEVRVRTREIDGWTPDIFRPFASADSYLKALQDLKPERRNLKSVQDVITHLETSENLIFFKGPENHYTKKMGTFSGHLDKIPAVADESIVKNFLLNRKYVSVKGKSWKSVNGKETYAPSSKGGFNIVPKDYAMGITKVDKATCTKCHDQTSRSLGDFLMPTVLYGEVWGEDQVFTWHLFKVDSNYYFLGDDGRKPNEVMVQAGLIKSQKPIFSSTIHQELKRPYSTKYWNGHN